MEYIMIINSIRQLNRNIEIQLSLMYGFNQVSIYRGNFIRGDSAPRLAMRIEEELLTPSEYIEVIFIRSGGRVVKTKWVHNEY